MKCVVSNNTFGIRARQTLREQLAADVEAFLRRGGSIEEVPAGLTADECRTGTSAVIERSRKYNFGDLKQLGIGTAE